MIKLINFLQVNDEQKLIKMSDSLIYDISQEAKRARLKKEIKRIRLKHKEVAEKSGIPKTYLSAMVNGKRTITDDKILQIKGGVPEFNANYVMFGSSSIVDQVAEQNPPYEQAPESSKEINFSRIQSKIEYQDRELTLLQNQMSRLLATMDRMDEELRQLRARVAEYERG